MKVSPGLRGCPRSRRTFVVRNENATSRPIFSISRLRDTCVRSVHSPLPENEDAPRSVPLRSEKNGPDTPSPFSLVISPPVSRIDVFESACVSRYFGSVIRVIRAPWRHDGTRHDKIDAREREGERTAETHVGMINYERNSRDANRFSPFVRSTVLAPSSDSAS